MVKTVGKVGAIILGMGAIFLLLWLGISCSQISLSPESTTDVIVFQTSGGFNAGVFAGLLFAGIPAVPLLWWLLWLLWSSRDASESLWLRFKHGVGRVLLGTFILAIVPGGLGAYFLYSATIREEIVIDKSAQVITMERAYLVRNEASLQLGFDEVAYVRYHYTPGSPAPPPAGYRGASGTVYVHKRDGSKIEISSDGPNSQRNLAEAIAEAVGKPLMED